MYLSLRVQNLGGRKSSKESESQLQDDLDSSLVDDSKGERQVTYRAEKALFNEHITNGYGENPWMRAFFDLHQPMD